VLQPCQSQPSTPWAVISGAETSIRVSIDPNGNLTGDGTKIYQWDAENRLVAVLQGATTLASFVYDGNGKRQQKIAGGLTHIYIYDEANVIEERIGTTQTLDYVQGAGIDQTLAQRDQAGVVSYYLTDHLGSIAQVTNSSGAVTLTREYDLWGNLLLGSATSGYAYTGREWDAEAGIYYYRARYYDPKIGRFISEDTIGFEGGVTSSDTSTTARLSSRTRPASDVPTVRAQV
jgi:RHS repeat-associated protein